VKKTVEYWHWQYRSPTTGQVRRTLLPLTELEASRYANAERIEQTRMVLEVDDDLRRSAAKTEGRICDRKEQTGR
jgi:hypothetical protein